MLNEDRFADKSPPTVYATLLDEGIYLCSIRTMYRILKERDEVRERRKQLRHPVYKKPELIATGPNQVWSWDITKLRGPQKHWSKKGNVATYKLITYQSPKIITIQTIFENSRLQKYKILGAVRSAQEWNIVE